MKDTPLDTLGDEPVEARLVAWVLGESSAFEAAELERLCEERPELLIFRRRMQALHGLLTEAEAAGPDQSWKLPPEKRKVLDGIIGGEKIILPDPQKELIIRRAGLRTFFAIAACLVMAVVVLQLIHPIWITQVPLRSVEKKVDFMPPSEAGGQELVGGLIPPPNAAEADSPNLRQAIRDQEDKVEERRKVLAAIVRTKSITYKGKDSFYGQSGVDEDQAARSVAEVAKDGTREEAIKRGLDAENYVDAKREFENDQQLLQSMKLKQITENSSRAAGGVIVDPEGKIEERNSTASVVVGNAFGESLAMDGMTPQIFDTRSKKSAPIPVEPAAPASAPVGATSEYKVILPTMSSNRELGLQQTARQLQLAKQPAKSQSGALPSDLAAVSSMLDNPEPSTPVEALPPIVASGLGGGGAGGRGLELKLSIPPSSPEALLPEMEQLFGQVDSAREFSVPADGGKQERLGAIYQQSSASASDSTSWSESKGEDLVVRFRGETTNQLGISNTGKSAEIEDSTNLYFPTEYDSPELANDSAQGKLLAKRGSTLDTPAQQKLVDLMEEIPASENPYSTFSLNISDASFQIARAALAKGERHDPESIKPEQFYNAVDYGDPAPASNEPVAAMVEQSTHPIIPGRNLVRVALRTGSVGRSAAQPLRLTLLVDQSGSMVREDRRAAMDHALAQLGGLLTKADLVTVVGFSRIPHLLADGMTGDQAAKLGELVNQTSSEGGTNLEEAMKLGGEMAARHQLAGAQNRIVLFTDGAGNLGDAKPERLAELVKLFRQKGLAFDIAGIGADGLNDRLLSELARNGNGRYYVVGNEQNDSFARQLAGAFRPAAENVKVQVNFNPQRVGKYKLIGFEKDRLKTEDFRNDAVDAAELAAEEAGVALYQVEPLADGSGELGEVSVRFRDAASQEMVERAWTIPYASQATAFDRATPSMQLAGLSLLAAEKLKGGPLADAIDFKQLSGPGAFVKQYYGSSPRIADMLRVIDALK